MQSTTIYIMKCLLFLLVEDQCPIENIYPLTDLSSIDKLMINGEIYDGYEVEALQKMTLDDGLYEVSVTRKDSDMYRVDYEKIMIETRYCYEYSYSQDAIIKWNGYSGVLIFVD